MKRIAALSLPLSLMAILLCIYGNTLAADADGGRTVQSARNVISLNSSALMTVYKERILETGHRGMRCKITIDVAIDEHGRVFDTRIYEKETDMGDTAFLQTVVDVIKTWDFGAGGKPGEVTQFSWMLTFHPYQYPGIGYGVAGSPKRIQLRYGSAKPAESQPAKNDIDTPHTADIPIEMVFVKGGTFTMGCTEEQGRDCLNDEKPAHSVTVRDFYIGKYEVTQKQWAQVTGSNPSRFKGDNLPVEMVSWSEVLEFIRKLNQQTGKRYRLPTEAEWEYAARGGASGQNFKYAGSDNIDEAAWYKSNSGRKTQPAGSKRPNELGIYDMSGNVWEWVNDRFGDYTAAAKVNPKGAPSGSSRVFRGGGWYDSAKMCRTSYRGKYDLLYPFYIGIRLAMDP